jgi:hypothetical protein
MILSRPFDEGDLVDFDPASGVASLKVNVEGVSRGNFYLLDQQSLAIYCENNTLFLQIGSDRWDLSSSDTELIYSHDFSRKTTCFDVKSQSKSMSIEYMAWWAVIPGFEPIEPEMDEEEDFLGYVFAVWKNKSLQKNLISSWI